MDADAGLTGTDRSKQSGFANLVTGLLGLYRKLNRTVTDSDLLEALTTMSLVHRRLDNAARASAMTEQCRNL